MNENGINKVRLLELLKVHLDNILSTIPETADVNFTAYNEPVDWASSEILWMPESIDENGNTKEKILIPNEGYLNISWQYEIL